MLKYITNSCYNDTLLTILFKSLSSFWRDNILTRNYTIADFQPLRCKNNIKSPVEVSEYSRRIRNELVFIYANLIKGNDITCSTVRPIFNECMGDLMVQGQWVTYAPDLIYGLLTDLYPEIKLVSEYEIKGSLNSQLVAFFTMWEFMEFSSVKNIRWDLINTEVLVFHNGGIPPISNYNQTGPESNIITYDSTRIVSEIVKDQAFSEFILNDRYVLIGVITLQGYKLGQEGGTHYVGYYRNNKGDWIYYDDTKTSEIKVEKLPERGVWKYISDDIPYMYFYQRTDKIKNEILNTIRKTTTEIKTLPIFGEILIPEMPPMFSFQSAQPISNIPIQAPARVTTQPVTNIPIQPVPTQPITNIPIQPMFNFQTTQPVTNIPMFNIPTQPITSIPIQPPSRVTTQPITNIPIQPPSNVPIQPIFNIPPQPISTITNQPIIYPERVNLFPGITNTFIESNIPVMRTPEVRMSPEDLPTKPLPLPVMPQIQFSQQPVRRAIASPGIIRLPTGSTIVSPPPEQVISVRPYESLSYKHDIGHNRADVLNMIDESKLLKGKKSSTNKGYKLEELQEFARLLGIKVNQSKGDLVDAIKEMKRQQSGNGNK